MANNSPTLVMASLSDDQLKKSIDSLVTHVDEAMKKMVQSTNNAVGEMEAKLKSLGSLKIDSGGTNDGGTGRRTQQHEKLTKAVNDASEAVSKETQKLQDLQQSLSGASDREQNFISQKERAANTIAQENDLLSKQQSELAALKTQEQQLSDAHQKDMQARQQNAAAIEKQTGAVKYYEEEIVSLQARLTSAQAKIDRFYEVQAKARESISSRLHAPSDQFIGYNDYERGKSVYSKTEQDVRSLIKALSELDNADKKHGFGDELRRAYMNLMPSQDMANVFKRQQEEISSYIKTLQEAKKGTKGETRANLDNQILAGKELLAIYKELGNAQNALNKTVQKEGLRDGGNVGGIKRDIEETKVAYDGAKQKLDQLTQSTQQSAQASQQKAQIDSQIAAKEKEIAETKGRIATAIDEQTKADKNASQAAKEKANIQSQVANQEKQVAEAKRQLTTATHQQAEVEKQSVQNVAQQTAARDKQIKKNQEAATSFDNFAKAQQVAIRSASPSGIRNADTLQTMNIQLDLLRERLREARQQYSSFVALAAHATTTGDKGLFQYATDGVHRYEQEVRNLIPQIRTLQSGIQQMGDVIAPQGHTIQNYVNSLQKANPELAALNAQYKSGTSLLQTQSTSYASATQSAQHYTEEVRKQAQAQQQSTQAAKEYSEQVKQIAAEIRQSAQWQKEDKFGFRRGMVSLEGRSYPVSENLSMGLRLEDQIVSVLQRANEERQKGVQTTQQQAQASQRLSEEDRKAAEQLGWIEEKRAKKRYISPSVEEVSQIRAALQSVTGQQEKWVDDIDKTKASYNQLSQYLKELKTIHADIWRDPKNANAAKVIAQEIQTVQREMQKWQQTMSRPVSLKDALGGSEKTLDDIAYKMQRLRAYKQGIDLTKPNAANEIKQVDEALARLQKDADKWMSKSQQMIKSNTALGRSWNYMKNRLAFYFTVGAGTQFIKNLIEVRSQYEMNERALGILIDSAERGTQIFNELSQMALVSPYTLIELSAAAKQLTAYDVAAKDVVDTTRRLADMASAVGIPIERLTYALGQIKAYGYLNSRDNRMFANAGIPLVKQLSDYYTELEGRLVSTADVYDRIKKKQVGYEEVMNVISRMTDEGGKFYDFQAKMAETLKVQLANLTLAWNNMLNAMGEESQGVLVGSISTLKQVFLHWKDIEHVLYELVVAFGAYKAYQIITTRLMGATAASLDAQVLAMKRNKAAMLEKQALTRKLTVDELRQVAAQNQVTAADYRNALSGKQLTKQKALLLVALNKNNAQLKAAVVNMGLLTTQEVANITTGKALAIVFKSIGISIRNAALAIKAFAASMWPLLVIGAIYELYHAWDSYGEHVKEINKQAAEHAKEAFENIKQYLESDVTSALQDRLAKGGKVESDAAGQKAWDEMREKIELSSSASNAFIAKLMQINDINARLSAGFGYLNDIQRVAGVMQTLEEDAVNISSTTLGGLLGEGLKDDLADFINAYQKYVSLNENLRQSGVGEEYFNDQKRALEEFRGEVEKTTTSLYDIASKEGFNTNEQREFFEREISEIAQAEQMGAKETRIFRMQAEKEYYAYARAQLVSQLEYQDGAQKALTQKRIDDLDNEFGKNKALQESFFTWLTEKQDHAVKNMLRGKTQEEIKQGEWLKDSNAKWVEEMARKFSKEYGVSFDDLHRLVLNANTWSINIPVFFQTIGQPLSDVQRDYEARTGKKFKDNPIIKDAKTQVEILDILKKKQKEVENEMETARKAGGKYWEDNKQRYKEENDALVADIHAYNALTDAEEKANKKKGKGSKKDPLLDALKQEISLVEKLQSDYDKLSKSGASQAEALETIRGAYGKTIRLLNAQLGKYGLPQLDISQLITGKDPNKALAHFKQTLDTLVSKGMLTLERSKELEAVVEKFTLSAKTYNLDMITKGLNNELGKLKDEYELAVELDANPELGDMFADMFGINTSTLPKTFGDALDRAQIIINRKLAEMNITTPFDLMEGNVDSFAKSTGLDKDGAVIKELVSAQNAYRDMFKKNITETEKMLDDYIKKYGDYSDKIAEIEAGRLEKLKKLNEAYYTEEMRKRPEYVAKLNAIEQGANKEKQQVDFDEFKNSRYYTMMFENLDYISTKTIRDMRDRVRELMDTINDLTPEQLKTLMSQYEKLEQKLVKRSPFKTLTKDLKEYFATSKERNAANQEFKNVQKEYDAQKKNVAALKEKYEQAKANSYTSKSYLDFLQIEIDGENDILKILKEQLDTAQKKADKYNLTAKLAKSEALQVAQVVGQNLQSLGELRDFLQQDLGVELSDELNGLVDGLSKVGQGINKITSAATSGDVVGIITGVGQTIYGIYDGIASIFGGGSTSDNKITKQIQDSERAVKQLELAYKNLEVAIENAYGTNVIGAKQAAIANKELQLAELNRQLALEKSRDSKKRDDDRIMELQGQIIDLQNDIKRSMQEITTGLLGISSVGDAALSFMDAYISALRKGEDAQKAFTGNWKEMIANMIKQLWVTKVIGPQLEALVDDMNKRISERSKNEAEAYRSAVDKRTRLSTMNGKEILSEITGIPIEAISWDMVERYKDVIDAYVSSANADVEKTKKELDKATTPTIEDMDMVAQAGEDLLPLLQASDEQINELLKKYGLYEDQSGKTLSSLQQGIQGITEDTAGALEGYMNGISQQVYLQSEYLRQIVEFINIDADPMDDVKVASLSQILLQLQTNYTLMQTIDTRMENWSTATGNGIRVELLS